MKLNWNFEDVEDFAAVITLNDVLSNKGNMAISLYVRPDNSEANFALPFNEALENWNAKGSELKMSMNQLFDLIAE